MRVQGKPMRTVWVEADGRSIGVIDQRRLPHVLETVRLSNEHEVARAISEMWIRGAPLIGAVAGFGLALALCEDDSDASVERAGALLLATRPTAVNLRWALDRMKRVVLRVPRGGRFLAAMEEARAIAEEDVRTCRQIGEHGARLLREAHERARRPIHVLTHCNAGWLATVDFGTALAPVYLAHDAGLPVHVWVDETRPRNQGSSLTSWELREHGIPCTVIADNAGGLLMQRGRVDLCLVGSDRTTRTGDVANKVGTYLKALAAKAHGIPFYVALPSSTIDWTIERGGDIPIEERDPREVTSVAGFHEGRSVTVELCPKGTEAYNPAFDVTPAAYVTGLITERGIATPSEEGLRQHYPEHFPV